jgi:ubiquinone/menaquinone biosynthesis C-methylase UbiE
VPPDTLSLDSLLRLHERGARGLTDILRVAAQGDWRARAFGLSAAGRIARAETSIRGLAGFFARRIPLSRRHFPVAGYHGRYVRNQISNGLLDRSWPVRVAAALALGDCRSASKIPQLQHLLKASLRAERIAAASAILSCGGRVTPGPLSLLAGSSAAPAHVGDTTRAIDILTTLAAAHRDVLAAWLRLPDQDRPAGDTPADWASFLAGPLPENTYRGPDAEIQRYDAEGETEYLLTKPFSHINHAQNVRLLHSFLVVAEHLRVPPGGRILDLGGGSGWVSELLTRLGFRPFTLDLSSSLLSIGTRRFARASLMPRFLVGDMMRLPVATGSMDAVVVLDALHHVPDVRAVFLEAFRVLVIGGQFILAEPGEGHAETQKSRGEMIEHGVLEREIHVFEAMEYGRKAGFDHIRAVPHYVPNISMSPEQLTAAISSSADDWMIYQDDRLGYLSPYLIQSTFDRPVLVFRKGSRVIDSRMPRTLKAEITSRLVRDGTRVSGGIVVRNVGDTVWLAGGDVVGQVRIAAQLLSADRRSLSKEWSRTALGADVLPGRTAEVPVELTLPDAETPYVLKVDLVDEGICLFEDVGSTPIYVALDPRTPSA